MFCLVKIIALLSQRQAQNLRFERVINVPALLGFDLRRQAIAREQLSPPDLKATSGLQLSLRDSLR
jgi:hypothetical protein